VTNNHHKYHPTPHGHHFGPDLDCERCGNHYGHASAVCVPSKPQCPVCGHPLRLLTGVLKCRSCMRHAAVENESAHQGWRKGGIEPDGGALDAPLTLQDPLGATNDG
jgi:hypothetical protein